VDVIRFAFGTADRSKGAAIKNFYSLTSRSGFFAGRSCSDYYDCLSFVLVRSSQRGILLFLFFVCAFVFMFLMHLVVREERDGRTASGEGVCFVFGGCWCLCVVLGACR
jgi:hypothetical protein